MPQPLQVHGCIATNHVTCHTSHVTRHTRTQVDFDHDMVIGSDAIERLSSMGACGLCALLQWLHCCWCEQQQLLRVMTLLLLALEV